MINARGIEVNPECVKAVLDMSPSARTHDVQRIVGKVNYLSRFFSKLAERSLPFFDILRKPKDFLWTDECARAFEELNEHLATLPTITMPVAGKDL